MSALGKATRLNRILAGGTRRVLTVAVDHMINYPVKFPPELRRMASTLEQVIAGEPDAVTMNKGAAMRLMTPYAGRVPLIIQSMALRPDEPDFADTATVEETLGLGADAIAVAMFVYGETELAYLRHLAEVVRCAAPLGLPVIPHIYPLESGDEKHAVVHDPEHVHYAARAGFEMGADSGQGAVHRRRGVVSRHCVGHPRARGIGRRAAVCHPRGGGRARARRGTGRRGRRHHGPQRLGIP